MNLRVRIIQFLLKVNEDLIFYPRLKKIYKSLQLESPTIFDVGVNKGQSIDFFCSIYKSPKIYGFEPNQGLFEKLKIKYPHENISLFNLGISDQCGILNLNETITSETSTFEKLNYDSNYLATKAKVLGVKKEDIILKSYPVPVITLKQFIDENKVNAIDILKIDTEGHELKCLLGLFIEKTIPVHYIQVERHNDDMYLHQNNVEIDNLLEGNGFELFEVIKHGFGEIDELIYKNKLA